MPMHVHLGALNESVDTDEILRSYDSCRAEQSIFRAHCREVAEVVYPDADLFDRSRNEGEKRGVGRQFDAAGMLALLKLASLLESRLTPRGRQWFGLEPEDPDLRKDAEIMRYLEGLRDAVLESLEAPGANFYGQMHEVYMGLGAFGNGALFTDEALPDESSDGAMRFIRAHIGNLCFLQNPHGVVDTIYREFSISAKAAKQMWGERTPPSVEQRLAANDVASKCSFLHCVRPRPSAAAYGRLGAGRGPFQSVYLSVVDRLALEVGGYHENPYAISRWTLAPEENYGRSPAMHALPNLNTLQEMMRTHIQAGHKQVDPPLLGYDDDELGGGRSVQLYPGGWNPGGLDSQGNALIKPLHTVGKIELSEAMLERERATVDDFFFVSLLQVGHEHPQRTATEVLQITEEQGWLMTPTLGRQQSELLGPFLRRAVAIMVRSGRVGPPPQKLLESGGHYKIVYLSPLTYAQRAGEARAIASTYEFLSGISAAKGGDPSVFDVMNDEEATRRFAQIQGVPQEVVRSEDEVLALRNERAQRQQLAEALAAGEQLGKIAKDVAASGIAAGPGAGAGMGTQPAV